jgi:hypothetical protein
MHIAIIANGFQEDYMEQLLNHLAGKVELIDFIGSSIHLNRKITDQVRFYNLRGGHEEKVAIYRKIARVLRYHFRLVSYLTFTRARVVHVQWFRFPVIEGILITLYMRMYGKKVIYTAHDVLPHSRDNRYNRMVYRLVYNLQHQIIVHTNYIKKRIVTEFGIPPEKIGYSSWYINVLIIRISLPDCQERLHLDPDALILLFLVSLPNIKFDLLTESIRQYHGKKRIQVLVAGRVSLNIVMSSGCLSGILMSVIILFWLSALLKTMRWSLFKPLM